MSEAPTYGTYGDLEAEDVRNIIPPSSKGAPDEMLEEFLAEAELDIRAAIGKLPEPTDIMIRAIIRDLAGARTILKLVGTDSDEGRRSGMALDEYAWDRLARWSEAMGLESGDATGQGSFQVSNAFPFPLFNGRRCNEPGTAWVDYPMYPGAPWAG